MAAARPALGFCGKLPSRADFVIRGLPLAYVEPWHSWLAELLAATRDALGGDWLDAYLYGPIWRFALPPGLVGPSVATGTLMPSVDSVGRYFPLTIALASPAAEALSGPLLAGQSWFAAIEALSLAALEDEIGLDELGERLAGLAIPPGEARRVEKARTSLSSPGVVLPFDPEKELADSPFASEAVAHLAAGNTLWWSQGTDRIPPSLILAIGLPTPRSFAAMLSGRWTEFGWRDETSPGLAAGAAMEGGGR